MTENTFRYKYSAKENSEIQEIRKKYLPKSESKLEELKRLDSAVEIAGTLEALCAGIGGALIFGLGLCLTMQILGSGIFMMVIGILLGIVGITGMLAVYPVYRKVYAKTKQQHTPRILELTAEFCSEKI